MTGMESLEPEPPHGWRVVRFAAIRDRLAALSIVAVDGRGSGGKTSFAARLAAAVPGAAVVHTDDIAWRQAVLDWADLLADGVLKPHRAGQEVAFRPPKWDEYDRPGAITVPAGAPLLIIEGVGCGRRSLADHYDAVVWLQSDQRLIDERTRVRVAAGETTPENNELWLAEELPFHAEERIWERADLRIAGSPVLDFDPLTEIVVAR